MIFYKKGNYKYRLVKSYSVQILIYPDSNIKTKYISLTSSGLLTLSDSYAWNGPSGPTIDTPNFIISSAPHDAVYQLIRMGLLNASHKKIADQLLRCMLVEQWIVAHSKPIGWFRIGIYNTKLSLVKARAQYIYLGVKIGGQRSILAESRKPILTAP